MRIFYCSGSRCILLQGSSKRKQSKGTYVIKFGAKSHLMNVQKFYKVMGASRPSKIEEKGIETRVQTSG